MKDNQKGILERHTFDTYEGFRFQSRAVVINDGNSMQVLPVCYGPNCEESMDSHSEGKFYRIKDGLYCASCASKLGADLMETPSFQEERMSRIVKLATKQKRDDERDKEMGETLKQTKADERHWEHSHTLED